MANVTGQGRGVVRPNRAMPKYSAAPRVQYATTAVTGDGGEGMRSLARVVSEVSSRIEDRLDMQAEADALREGAVAGYGDEVPALQASDTIRGRAFNHAARDALSVNYDLKGIEALTEYEEAHEANPTAFKARADEFLKGAMPKLQAFDPAMAGRVEAEYKLRAQSALNRVKERQRVIVRDQQMENAMRLQLRVQDEMANDAGALFDADPAEAQNILARMVGNTAKLVDTANQFGADGRPLFSARERIIAERQAGNLMSEQIGLAWMRKQPDILAAWKDWQSGAASITLASADGLSQTVNLKSVLGEGGYSAASAVFIDNLKSELSLRTQIETVQDRAFEKGSDQNFSELSLLAQEGQLTLPQVEERRQFLTPEKLTAARLMAKKGGASVSEDSVYVALSIKDSKGVDIRGELATQYSDGKLSRDDYLKLYERNEQRAQSGLHDPVEAGRLMVTKMADRSLAGLDLKNETRFVAATVNAEADYEISVDDFRAEHQRSPNRKEAAALAREAIQHNMLPAIADQIVEAPTPMYLSRDLQAAGLLTKEQVDEAIKLNHKKFIEKHNGNKEALASDPLYLDEVKKLRDLRKLASDRGVYLNEK